MKIFIVEDNPLYSAVLEQNLNTCGYSDIERFEDGETCLKHVNSHPQYHAFHDSIISKYSHSRGNRMIA